MKDSIFSNIKQLDDTRMDTIQKSFAQVKQLTQDLISHKKQAIFSDKFMSQEVFQLIRDNDNEKNSAANNR